MHLSSRQLLEQLEKVEESGGFAREDVFAVAMIRGAIKGIETGAIRAGQPSLLPFAEQISSYVDVSCLEQLAEAGVFAAGMPLDAAQVKVPRPAFRTKPFPEKVGAAGG